ncbi:hypothetical protein BDP27DRAFT_1322500 [Rhodocollybia butyracea]|uniref:Telomere-associated protein Rif1 N-terminal domain-containing protein n=1 Tax=Rhodocollybia butyracea TaxID=206335 RepID=A0A9P5Q043_9AGAR|nr:hypothetical protein BDP27DRAFT_1322500 [Rhodocollybia butyracea]
MNQNTRDARENIPITKPYHEANEEASAHINSAPSMASSPSTSAHGSKHSIISIHYLQSPLNTLEDSLTGDHFDLHDLSEAYNVLSTRIKDILLRDVDSEQALSVLREQSHTLTNALRRDVMRVLTNPYLTPRRDDMDPEEVQFARDLAMLGQQAIRLISELFAFPQLSSTMSDDQLRLLLHDVLAILSEPSLPTPHSKRTFALLRWTLQSQKLPENVLTHHKKQIMATVKQSLEGEKLSEQIVIDGLKILAELLRGYGRLFLSSACDLLDAVLNRLIAETLSIRFAAGNTLSAFVHAKIMLLLGNKHKVTIKISRTVRKFSLQYFAQELPEPESLEELSQDPSEEELSQEPPEDLSQKPPLYCFLSSAFAISQLAHDGDGPQWAAAVLASLIVLFDERVFTSLPALRHIKALLWKVSEHQSITVKYLHPSIWRSFVWAFARIPSEEELSRKVQVFLSQDYRNGVGALACYVTMNFQSDDSVGRTLGVVADMFKQPQARMDAIHLTCQLLGSSSDASSSIVHVLQEKLFDGQILETHLANLREKLRRIPNVVRSFSIAEITPHWNKLHEFWIAGVKFILNESQQAIPQYLFEAWRTLISTAARIHKDHTLPPPIVQTLEDLSSESILDISDVRTEIRQIHLLRGLWKLVQASFTGSSLDVLADYFLGAVVRRNFDISSAPVQSEWVHLCQDIRVYPLKGAGRRLNTKGGPSFNTKTWVAVARVWIAAEGASGDNLITFLKFYFPEQLSTDEELELWKKLFYKALAASKAQPNAKEAVLNLWNTFISKDEEVILAFPRQFHALISAFADPFDNDMSEEILAFIDHLLLSLYPPSIHPLSVCLRYIDTIRGIVTYLPEKHLVPCLAQLSNCLCLWIEDKSPALPDEMYSQHVLPLYKDVLRKLRNEEPNETTLLTLWKFLVAPFQRPMDKDQESAQICAKAADAFDEFWSATYQGKAEFFPLYDQDLKKYLKALALVENGNQADGLTQSEDSQKTDGSYVPETQPLEPAPVTGSQAMANYVDMLINKGNEERDLADADIVPSSSSPLRAPLIPSWKPVLRQDIDAMAVDRPEDPGSSAVSTRGMKRKRQEKDQDATPPETSFLPKAQAPPIPKPKTRLRMAHVEVMKAQHEPLRTPTRPRKSQTSVIAASTWNRGSQLMTPEPSAPPSSHHGHAVHSAQEDDEEEDYGSWEKGVASPSSFAQISRDLEMDDTMDGTHVAKRGEHRAAARFEANSPP